MDKSIRYKLGLALAVIGALLCIFGTLAVFMRWYHPVMGAEVAAGRPDEKTIVQYVFPALSDIGVIAGVLWALAALAFGMRKPWAWTLGVVANVMALQSSFFPMIPPVTRGLPPANAIIFVPSLVSFVLMLTLVRKVDWWVLVISLFSGIAMVLSFMNGVASTDKIIVTGASLFVAVQRLNWIAALGWGVFTVGLIVKPVDWVRWVGRGAATLELVAGLPLGIVTAAEAGRFSMFLPAPLLSGALLILLLLPLGTRLTTRNLGVQERLAHG
ncbi:MAG: hypothetical protein JXC32_19285 [Anaerolineae bacterium]|nr:hypothetical protein [Anaerolineae bacterium]